jgi:hypothetical protein
MPPEAVQSTAREVFVMSLTINQIKGAREFCIGEDFESGPRDEAIDTLLDWITRASNIFQWYLDHDIADSAVLRVKELLAELD